MQKTFLLTGIFFSLLLSTNFLFAQCVSDNFESGTFGPPWNAGSGYTQTIVNTDPAQGIYSLRNSGFSAFYQGPNLIFTPFQPTEVSWWIKTDVTNGANGYFVLGNINIHSDNGILFSYCNSTSGLRFFNNAGYNHPISANTWYHVEVKNIDWTARNMDIYVDGNLILENWAFRSSTATYVDRLHILNLDTANPQYDDIRIGSDCVGDPDDDGDGYTVGEGDCDDTDDTVYPGAPELCDGKDNDCNTLIDDNVSVGVPTGITSMVLTATSAYIDWNDSPDADRWQVRYRVQGTNTWTTTANLFVSNTTLMGLLPNNIYQYQVRARCTNANNSAWSATYTFFTNTCFAPTGLAVSNITANSALASWNAAAGAISYMIRYRKIGQGWTLTSSASTSKTLTGLLASTNYEVQVASFCTSGAGGWSASVLFTTAAPKSFGQGLTLSQPQGSQIDWSIYPNPGQSGQLLSIELQTAKPEAGVLSILDLQGKVIFQQPWQLEQGFNQRSLDGLQLNTGLYFVTIRLSDQVLTKRWVVNP